MEFDFASKAVDLAIKLTTSSSESFNVVRAIFLGLERLFITFSLSHQHRLVIVEFSKSLITAPSNSGRIEIEYNLWALALLLTCMYTSTSDDNSQVGNHQVLDTMENVIVFCNKIREESSIATLVIAKVLPYILLDFFPPEQVLGVVVGEFMNERPNPHLLAHVLFNIFGSLHQSKQQELLLDWTFLSLQNFLNKNTNQHLHIGV